jgi:rhodanese-related sulfurtransferase
VSSSRRSSSTNINDDEALGPDAAAQRVATQRAAATATTSSSESLVATIDAEPPRVEPTLDDLDISIPQVDCRFLADLVRCRRRRKEEFDDLRGAALEKVEEAMKRAGVDPSAQEEERAMSQLEDKEKALVTRFRPDYDDGFVLIDTRTVAELASWGAVEGSKVLPAHEMWDAFHMTPPAFEETYGFPKPTPDQTIIFICQYGGRSLMAAQILSWMGYPKVMHFRDGFYEWSKQFHMVLRKTMTHDIDSGNDTARRATFEAARELQRSVAPEFNALPIQEASRYVIDGTRSLGTKRVGDGLRAEAFKRLAEQKMLLFGDSAPAQVGLLPDDVSTMQSGINDLLSQEAGLGLEADAPMGLSDPRGEDLKPVL